MSAADTSKRTTGHPTKDSGGGMNLDPIKFANKYERRVWRALEKHIAKVRRAQTEANWWRYCQTREYRRAYARHWKLEGPQ